MRYVSALSDPELRAELMGDLSGLVVGSAFLLSTPEQVDSILRLCDNAARKIYDELAANGKAAEVECITLDAGGFIGFDSLKSMSDLPDDAQIVPLYRYFDTPREAIVGACIVAPSEMKKTREVTFFCGPDRRKTGDYRIFSIHPGPKRQIFPSRYQPEAVRKANRNYWDRHVFLATPNQVIAARMHMRAHYRELEIETRDRIFHMTRQIDGALHHWYGTWENARKPTSMRDIMGEVHASGDYGMAPDGTVYYFTTSLDLPPPDLSNRESFESRLSNKFRPSVIYTNGGEEYYLEGRKHRVDGIAVIEPQPDGGWIEYWYEDGLISRAPDQGSAKFIYNAKGICTEEISIYRGVEVQETVLGEAADAIKKLQAQLMLMPDALDWWEGSQDFALLRSQIEFASNRTRMPKDKIVRQMRQTDEQTALRWDFDRTLEQDPTLAQTYDSLVAKLNKCAELLLAGAQAMRFVRGDPNIVNAIWGKVIRDITAVAERGSFIPDRREGFTAADNLIDARTESKKHFQSMDEMNKAFSATGR